MLQILTLFSLAHSSIMEALNKPIQDLSRPLVPDPALPPRPLVPDAVYPLDRLFQTRSTTYIPVGVPPCRRTSL